MIIREIKTSAFFEKRYKKLAEQIKAKAKERERIFRDNPLHGEKKDE